MHWRWYYFLESVESDMIKEIRRSDRKRKVFISRISNKMSYMSTNTIGIPLQLDTSFFFNLVVKD